MSNEIELRLKISPEDLRKAQAQVDQLDDTPLSLGGSGRPGGGAPVLPDPSKTTKGYDSLGATLGKVGIAMGGMALATSAADTVFQAFLDKDEQLAELAKMTGFAGAELAKLDAIATSMSNKWGTSVTANIEGMKVAISKLGPEIANDSEAFQSIINDVNTFAVAAKTDAATSADILSSALLGMGYSSLDATGKAQMLSRMTNVLAAASQVGAIEADQVSASMIKSGGAARDAGLSMEETAAMIEVLGEKYKDGSENGTQFLGILAAMGKGRFLPESTRKELEALGIDVNKVADATIPFADRLKMLSPLLKDSALAGVYFGDGVKVAGVHALNSVQKFNDFSKGVTNTTTAMDQANIGMDTYKSKWDKITNFLTNFGVKVLENVRNTIVDLVDDISNFGGMISDLFSADWDSLYKRMSNTAQYKKAQAFMKATEEQAKKTGQAVKGAADASGKKDEADKKQIVTLAELRKQLTDAQAALEKVDEKDKSGAAKARARIESIQKRIDALTGSSKAAKVFVAGSLGAMEEAAGKLREKLKSLPADSKAWFETDRTIAALEADIDLITSKAAERWGNNLDEMKAYIKAKSETVNEEIRTDTWDVWKQIEEDLGSGKIQMPELDADPLKDELDEFVGDLEEVAKMSLQMGDAIGSALSNALINHLPVLREVLRTILVTTLDFLERIAVMQLAEAAMKDYAAYGPLGVLKTALTAGLILGALKTAKAAITGFASGGVIVGERGPEIIAPAKEFSEFAGQIVANAMSFMRTAVDELAHARNQNVMVSTALTSDPIVLRADADGLYATIQLVERQQTMSILGGR